ncbi:MAG: twin-arginine translocase TatA/TatE family subunit [Pirellulales bacterium]|nr:twin-arginine translocase TatA/TatE family subunit [Pirellulales bacterium]
MSETIALGMPSMLNLLAFGFGPMELAIVAGIVLLLFGGRLPGAMRNLGRSVVEFKKGVKDTEELSDATATSAEKTAEE